MTFDQVIRSTKDRILNLGSLTSHVFPVMGQNDVSQNFEIGCPKWSKKKKNLHSQGVHFLSIHYYIKIEDFCISKLKSDCPK